MLQFTYDRNLNSITATTNCILDYTLVGGGGGGGGYDATYAGGFGLGGGRLTGRITLNAGDTVYCIVGQGGRGGLSNAHGTGGGVGGESWSNYSGLSGGTGGNAGPNHSSGSGGGGGGATVLYKNNTEYYAIAAGGGGGGGAGYKSNGYMYSNGFYLAEGDPLTGPGGKGQDHRGDGGGAGGGGGGWTSGVGGMEPSGDTGAMSGSSGLSINTTINYGVDFAAFIAGYDPYKNAGLGGEPAINGADGYAIFSSVLVEANVKQAGQWNAIRSMMVRNNNEWIPIEAAYVKTDGAWTLVYGRSNIESTSVEGGSNITGVTGAPLAYPSSVTPGTPPPYATGVTSTVGTGTGLSDGTSLNEIVLGTTTLVSGTVSSLDTLLTIVDDTLYTIVDGVTTFIETTVTVLGEIVDGIVGLTKAGDDLTEAVDKTVAAVKDIVDEAADDGDPLALAAAVGLQTVVLQLEVKTNELTAGIQDTYLAAKPDITPLSTDANNLDASNLSLTLRVLGTTATDVYASVIARTAEESATADAAGSSVDGLVKQINKMTADPTFPIDTGALNLPGLTAAVAAVTAPVYTLDVKAQSLEKNADKLCTNTIPDTLDYLGKTDSLVTIATDQTSAAVIYAGAAAAGTDSLNVANSCALALNAVGKVDDAAKIIEGEASAVATTYDLTGMDYDTSMEYKPDQDVPGGEVGGSYGFGIGGSSQFREYGTEQS